jgi:hypothetical protein
MSQYGIREQTSGLGAPVIKRKSLAQHQGNYSQPPKLPTSNQPYNIEEDDRYYVTRPHTSARRYNVKYGAPPVNQPIAQTKRRVHWLTWVGVAFFIMIIGWVAFNAVSSWWQGVLDNFTYGTPRTFQIDANVGHNGRVSHFIAINLNGEVEVIETQKGPPKMQKSTPLSPCPKTRQQFQLPSHFRIFERGGE